MASLLTPEEGDRIIETISRGREEDARPAPCPDVMGFNCLQEVANIAMAREIAERITIDPAVMVGKPVIKGTRMPVELVLAKLAVDPDLDEFFLDYPELTVEDVKAVLAYASTLVPKRETVASRQPGG